MSLLKGKVQTRSSNQRALIFLKLQLTGKNKGEKNLKEHHRQPSTNNTRTGETMGINFQKSHGQQAGVLPNLRRIHRMLNKALKRTARKRDSCLEQNSRHNGINVKESTKCLQNATAFAHKELPPEQYMNSQQPSKTLMPESFSLNKEKQTTDSKNACKGQGKHKGPE
ncbi:hypothetical protein M9H77_05067 [Catharanthus roseus]|uniref:Uncharacterized protein n=1 Tax=Catharanthus roseus TaxID=4058 RepID=A0ACC0CFU7_CATRO|nr:hypothetical protein M9H77_05067 [Catharanthus roseus]